MGQIRGRKITLLKRINHDRPFLDKVPNCHCCLPKPSSPSHPDTEQTPPSTPLLLHRVLPVFLHLQLSSTCSGRLKVLSAHLLKWLITATNSGTFNDKLIDSIINANNYFTDTLPNHRGWVKIIEGWFSVTMTFFEQLKLPVRNKHTLTKVWSRGLILTKKRWFSGAGPWWGCGGGCWLNDNETWALK